MSILGYIIIIVSENIKCPEIKLAKVVQYFYENNYKTLIRVISEDLGS